MNDLFVISIKPNLVPEYPEPEEEDECRTATAQICTYTESFGAVAQRGMPISMATQESDFTIPFINHLDHDMRATTTTTATTTVSFCTSVTGCGATDITSTSSVIIEETPRPYVIIPRDPLSLGNLRQMPQMQAQDIFESRSDALGTIFFFIPALTIRQGDAMNSHPEVAAAYVPRGKLTEPILGPWNPHDFKKNITVGNTTAITNFTRRNLHKRTEISEPYDTDTTRPEMILISWPPNNGPVALYSDGYRYEDVAGLGTFMYGCHYGITPSHNEFTHVEISFLYPGPNAVSTVQEDDPSTHGSKCMAKAVGKTQGIARKAKATQTVIEYNRSIMENFLDGLLKIHEDIRSKKRGTKSVVNISVSIHKGMIPLAYKQKMGKPLRPFYTEAGQGD